MKSLLYFSLIPVATLAILGVLAFAPITLPLIALGLVRVK